MHSWSRVPSTAAGSRSSPAAARPVDRRQRRQDRPHRARTSASAASSSSRTPTATPTRTARLAKVAKTYPAPQAAHDDARRRSPRSSRCRPRTPSRPRPPPTTRRRRASQRAKRRAATPSARKPPQPAAPPRRRDPPSSACSPTRSRPNAGRAGGDAAGVRAHRQDRRQPDLQGYFTRSSASTARTSHQAAAHGLARRRRHHPRPHRQGSTRSRPRTCCSRSARPAAAPRASTRSRSSTAGSCSSRPRSTAPRARTRSSARTPSSPTIGQILLMSKEALVQHVLANPRIEVYSCGARRHPLRRRSTAACWRRSSSSPPPA